MAGKLSAVFCKTAPIGKYSDGGGLYLHITDKGKYWRRAYRFDGKQKIASFGVYPTTSLQEARAANAIFTQQLKQGIDPNAEKKAAKARLKSDERDQALTVSAVATEWLINTNNSAQWAENTNKRNTNIIENHLLPAFGSRPISSITALEIAEHIKAINAQGKNTTAHKMLSIIKAVFDYAVMMGYLLASPAASIKKIIPPESNAPMRHITDPQETGRVLVVLSQVIASPQMI